MPWPQATDYTASVQDPASSFRDPDLRAAAPELNAFLGLPLSYCGNFAIVFKLAGPGGTWAVKCFTRAVTDHQERYAAISRHLAEVKKRFAVEFAYLDEGIRVNGGWYPCVKMRWVEGHTLNDFLRDHADDADVLEQLAGRWLRLAGELRDARMAHGDLQHGNVLLVPGQAADSVAVRLVDYDGMWVPELAGRPPGERGHPNYQHPHRLRHGACSAEIDRFAHLAIYAGLRCLRVGGRALWDRHDSGENLLFREADFANPAGSKLLPELLGLPDSEAVALVGHLVTASQGPLDAVPLLSDLTIFGTVQPLSGEQRDRLADLVPGAKAFRRVVSTPAPPTRSSPRLPAARPPKPAGPSFGEYEIVEEVSRGPAWRVLRARRAGRVVGLRTLGVDPADLRRVLAEAEAAAALSHPHVLPTVQVGQRDGVAFLAAHDAPGGSMAALLPELRADPGRAARLLLQVATAVGFAHRRLVLHRALCPENVVLDGDGSALVAGFGLAVRPGPFGSGPYAAPEARRGEATAASDVWSLGAILYDCLTGAPPDDDPGPPWELNRDADARLGVLALRCLRPDPGERPADAAAVADELGRWCRGEPPAPAPPAPARHRRLSWPALVTLCVLLLSLVGGGAWVMSRPEPRPEPPPGVPARAVPEGGERAVATPARPRLDPIDPVTVRPGRPAIVRAGLSPAGPRAWELRVTGLPEGVLHEAAWRDGVPTVRLSAAADVRPGTATAALEVFDGAERVARREFTVAAERSVTVTGPDLTTLRPGEPARAALRLTRTGHGGPLTLIAEDLPDGVTAEAVSVPEGAETAELVLTVGPAAAPKVRHVGRVTAWAGGERIGASDLLFEVERGPRR